MSRYINANFILKGIKFLLKDSKELVTSSVARNAMIELVEKAKTVDAVKRGEWIRVSGYVTPGEDPVWRCSVCGKGLHVYGIEHNSYGSDIADHQWVACPNCGAKMDADHIADDGKKAGEKYE